MTKSQKALEELHEIGNYTSSLWILHACKSARASNVVLSQREKEIERIAFMRVHADGGRLDQIPG